MASRWRCLMANNYELGNLNASLFATEGVASVGSTFAPLAALACGFVIALGNRASAGLPARFVLLSSGMLVQVLINIPLTIALLTYGGALLFLLWYVTPRTIFERKMSGQSCFCRPNPRATTARCGDFEVPISCSAHSTSELQSKSRTRNQRLPVLL